MSVLGIILREISTAYVLERKLNNFELKIAYRQIARTCQIFPLTWQLIAAETGECPPQALLRAPKIQPRTRYGNADSKLKMSYLCQKWSYRLVVSPGLFVNSRARCLSYQILNQTSERYCKNSLNWPTVYILGTHVIEKVSKHITYTHETVQ